MVKSAKLPKLHIVKDTTKPNLQHNGQNQEEFLIHVGEILKAKASLEALKKVLKTKRRAAQDSGYNLADMDEAIAMREQEPETVKATIYRKAQYASWMGLAPVLQQGDLFTDADESPAAVWEKEGYEDGLLGFTATAERYDMSTEAGQMRMKHWNRGDQVRRDRLDQINAEFKQKAKDEKAAAAAKAKTKSDKKAAKPETVN